MAANFDEQSGQPQPRTPPTPLTKDWVRMRSRNTPSKPQAARASRPIITAAIYLIVRERQCPWFLFADKLKDQSNRIILREIVHIEDKLVIAEIIAGNAGIALDVILTVLV